MMSSIEGRVPAERPVLDSAERMRPRLRLIPRLEMLEARCLLSGAYPGGEFADGRPLPVRGTTVAESPVDSFALDRRGVRLHTTPVGGRAGSATDVETASTTSGVGVSWSDGTTLPGIPGLPRAHYVIVPEIQSPHQTFATAQGLPDLPYFGVVGTIGSGDPIELYRLTLNSGAEGLNFGLVADQSVPIQLQVFDGSGNLLGEWSSSSHGTTSLDAALGAVPAGSTIYFGITAGSPGGSGAWSTSIGYQLWVGVQSTTAGATIVPGSGTPGPSSANPPTVASPLPASTGLGAVPSGVNSPTTPTSPPSPDGGMRVAVGSPATRSAGPSGGLLSDGDPAPPVASNFSAVVNKDWDESLLARQTARPADKVEPADSSGPEREPDALVVIHGPGGFPLLGAVALGHRRGNSTVDMGDVTAPPALSYEEFQAAARALPAASDVPSTDATVSISPRAFHDRRWGRFSVPIFSGLGLATVFTLNAVLSPPMAGFDYLTGRLDATPRTRTRRRDRNPA